MEGGPTVAENPDPVPVLREVFSLREIDARIYALGLERRTITTADLRNVFDIPQAQGGAHLLNLARRGFFTPVVASQARGGRGSLRRFRVVPLSQSLMGRREAYRQLERLAELEEADEEIEQSHGSVSDEIVIVPARTLLAQLRKSADSAIKRIEIVCNDGTWVGEGGLVECLERARKRGVAVIVHSAGLPRSVGATLRAIGVTLRRAPAYGLVFALFDRKVLYVPFKEGRIRVDYSALYTTNPYLVEKVTNSMVGSQGAT